MIIWWSFDWSFDDYLMFVLAQFFWLFNNYSILIILIIWQLFGDYFSLNYFYYWWLLGVYLGLIVFIIWWLFVLNYSRLFEDYLNLVCSQIWLFWCLFADFSFSIVVIWWLFILEHSQLFDSAPTAGGLASFDSESLSTASSTSWWQRPVPVGKFQPASCIRSCSSSATSSPSILPVSTCWALCPAPQTVFFCERTQLSRYTWR